MILKMSSGGCQNSNPLLFSKRRWHPRPIIASEEVKGIGEKFCLQSKFQKVLIKKGKKL